jgi:hypothetical protein
MLDGRRHPLPGIIGCAGPQSSDGMSTNRIATGGAVRGTRVAVKRVRTADTLTSGRYTSVVSVVDQGAPARAYRQSLPDCCSWNDVPRNTELDVGMRIGPASCS